MSNAERDENYVPVLLGVSSVDWEPLPVLVNPLTGWILIEW